MIGDVVGTCQHEYCKRVEDIHKYINGYIHGQCGEVKLMLNLFRSKTHSQIRRTRT